MPKQINSKFKLLRKKPINHNLSLASLKKQTSSVIIFTPNFVKEISKEKISLFWKRYFSGQKKVLVNKREKKGKTAFISKYNEKVIILPVTSSVAGVVRKLPLKEYITYKKKYFFLKDILANTQFKFSQVLLSEVLSFKEKGDFGYILERVFPSISFKDYIKMYDVLEQKFVSENININRYASSFLKTLKENKIDPLKFYADVLRAHEEIEYTKSIDNHFDTSINNFIILGYNKETGKVKFGFIDICGRNSKSF